MSKTILEWYDELPAHIAERAKRNTNNERLNHTQESLETAIRRGFAWSGTPEDYDYWDYVCTGNYSEADKLFPPTPKVETKVSLDTREVQREKEIEEITQKVLDDCKTSTVKEPVKLYPLPSNQQVKDWIKEHEELVGYDQNAKLFVIAFYNWIKSL